MNYSNVYINGIGSFFPGDPVPNEEIDQYIQPINGQSGRLKGMILRENGIERRYYGIDKEGNSKFSLCDMGAESSKNAFEAAGVSPADIGLLCTGTVGGDHAVPGYANQLQGQMKLQPMETSAHTGICASGMIALRHAADAIELKRHENALVTATEYPSRMFKKTRFVEGYDTDFDAHFLRWMLSDASGSFVVSSKPKTSGHSLKLTHLHIQSFSGDYPTCMQIGSAIDQPEKSYLDYPTLAEAEKAGAFLLRQNIRLLPLLFEVGIYELVTLARKGVFKASEIDHFVCHYSSMKFAPVVKELLEKSDLNIPDEKWYSNLKVRGNTGAASIFVMLDDFMKERKPKVGEKILCFIPESGRFTAAYLFLEVVDGGALAAASVDENPIEIPAVAPPANREDATNELVRDLLQDLSLVWHDYRSNFWRSKFFSKVSGRTLNAEDYRRWMATWVPQVREGSKWMRTAAANLTEPFFPLKDLISEHAGEEQNDWKILFEDYRNAGGTVEDPDTLKRNLGGEALNSFMFQLASQPNTLGLLGGIYIIEGTGQRIIPAMLPLIKTQLGISPTCFRFLQYHGSNDENHLNRWLTAVGMALELGDSKKIADDILRTAQVVSKLYLLQLDQLDLT